MDALEIFFRGVGKLERYYESYSQRIDIFFTGTSSTRNQRTIYQRSVSEWKERKELGSRVGPMNSVVHRPLVEHETCSKSETIRRGPRN